MNKCTFIYNLDVSSTNMDEGGSYTLNTELAIHALGQVHCPTSILEPKLGFSKILPPSIFNHLCSPNYDGSYIA
jgi:hypothetical protein